jgi:hypothetical protein
VALPTSSDLVSMDYAFQAQPFVSVPAKNFSLLGMDYSFQAQPFVSNPFPTPPVASVDNSIFFGMNF